MVTLEEIKDMSIAITLGEDKPPESYDEEHRDQWKRLFRQIKEIKAKGGTVDIPMETPG